MSKEEKDRLDYYSELEDCYYVEVWEKSPIGRLAWIRCCLDGIFDKYEDGVSHAEGSHRESKRRLVESFGDSKPSTVEEWEVGE